MTAEGWWVAFILQPVCLSIPTCLSLPKLSEAAHANLSGRWGGRLFTCHLRDAQATQSAAYNTVCLNLVKPNRCNATHSPDSLKNPSVCVYLLPGSFRRTPHLLFIPWNKAGPWQEHRRHAQTYCFTHIYTQPSTEMGLLLLLKSQQLWRGMGGTVGICICRWEKKLHLPQGPAVEMNQLSMVCRSDPILLITKSQNNKDQKVVGHTVCSPFVVP